MSRLACGLMISASLQANNMKSAYVHCHATRADGSRDSFVTLKCPVKVARLWWQHAGLSFTATGYGGRIPTQYKVQLNGKWRRVYCAIYSNTGTCYIGKSLQTGFKVQEAD